MRVRIIEQSYRPENIKSYKIESGKYYVYKTISTEGEYVITEVSSNCYSNELSSQYIQISGYRLLEGEESLCPYYPGLMSMMTPYFLPAGRKKRVTKGVSELWCFINTQDLESPLTQVQSLKLETGESFQGITEDRLFIIHGTVVIDGIEYSATDAPKFLKLSGPRTVSASSSLVYLFKWPETAA